MGDATPIDPTTGGEVADPMKSETPEEVTPEKETPEKPDEVVEEKDEEEKPSDETPSKEDKVEEDSGETFAKSFDPKKLSPELQEAYKSMQADYTRKTQEIANVRKAAEAYDRFRPHLQKIFADENLSKQVFGDGQPKEVEYPDDPIEYAKVVKEQAINEMRQEMVMRERQRMAAEADDRDRSEAEKVDSRLNSDPEFGATIAGLVMQDQQYRNREITAVEATKKAIQKFDDYVSNVAKKRNEDLVKKAKESSSGVSSKTSPSNTVATDKALSIRDAWKEAESELANK